MAALRPFMLLCVALLCAACVAADDPAEELLRPRGTLEDLAQQVERGDPLDFAAHAKAPPLFRAVEAGDLAQLRRRLAVAKRDGGVAEVQRVVRSVGDSGETALHMAAVTGDADVVGELLAAGADPNARATAEGALAYPPLLWHVHGGHAAAVLRLLSGGADPNLVVPSESRPGAYETALDVALRQAHRARADPGAAQRVAPTVTALRDHGAKTLDELLKSGTSLELPPGVDLEDLADGVM